MMKSIIKYFVSVSMIMLISVIPMYSQKDTSKVIQKKHKLTFVDEDGDGYNDNAPDHDGDGIPNGLDPDYIKMKKERKRLGRYIDLDGDGINDYSTGNRNRENVDDKLIDGNQKGSSINKHSGKMKGKGGGKK